MRGSRPVSSITNFCIRASDQLRPTILESDKFFAAVVLRIESQRGFRITFPHQNSRFCASKLFKPDYTTRS
jgi:hypothetical protein